MSGISLGGLQVKIRELWSHLVIKSYWPHCKRQKFKDISCMCWLGENSISNLCVMMPFRLSVHFSSVQSLSRVQLFVTPWIAAHQACMSFTNSWSSLKLMSVESVMPSSHLILSSPSPPAPNPSQHQNLFHWVNSSHEVAKVLEFQLQHQSFQRTPRTDLL